MSDRRIPVDKLDAAVDLIGRRGRGAIIPMQGDSMIPTLHSGQRVAVELSPSRLERGDLVLFRQVDYLVVHRLLGPASHEDGGPVLRTRGDGLSGFDPPVDRQRVRGRVVAIEQDGQWWDLEGGAARAWALAVALHDLFWAGLNLIGARADRMLGRVGLNAGLQYRTARVDRFLLRLGHRWLFGRVHRRSPRRPPGFRASSDGS